MNTFYCLRNKKYYSKRELILESKKRKLNWEESSLVIEELPSNIQLTDDINLYQKSQDIFKKIKDTKKKTALLISGGIDSRFMLECFIQNNVAPDCIIIYTADPFDGREPFSAFYIEPKTALDDIIEKKSNTPILGKTEIINIHVGGREFYEFYADTNWPLKNYAYFGACGAPTDWARLPYIDNYLNSDDYLFLMGGSMPIMWREDNRINVSFIDNQCQEIINGTFHGIDFTHYDKNFFNAYCSSMIKNALKYSPKLINVDFSKSLSFAGSNTLKYTIPEISELDKEVKSSLSKSFKKHFLENNFLDEVNNIAFKNRLLYLQSVKDNPKWFDLYLNGVKKHEDWLKTIYYGPGTLTKPILTSEIPKEWEISAL